MSPKINIETKQSPGWEVKRGGGGKKQKPNRCFEFASRIGESVGSVRHWGVFQFPQSRSVGPHFPTWSGLPEPQDVIWDFSWTTVLSFRYFSCGNRKNCSPDAVQRTDK